MRNFVKNVTFDDQLIVQGIKVVGHEKLFVAMPLERDIYNAYEPDDECYETVIPFDDEFGEIIGAKIISAYMAEIDAQTHSK